MSNYFSAQTGSFFPASLIPRYQKAGTLPADAIEVTSEEWETYGKVEPPAGYRRGSDENGRPTWVPIPPPDLGTLATRKRREIDAARDGAFAAGMPYTFADGSEDVIQTRPQDQINLLGLSAKAKRLIDAGEGDTLMTFRGQSNVNRELTAEDMDALTLAALAHIEAIYQHSWDRKDAIDAALEAEDRDGIEAVEW